MYLHPDLHEDYFPDHAFIEQHNIKEIFSLIKPIDLEKNDLEILLDKDYAFTKDKLKQYFEDLASYSTKVSQIFLKS